MCTKCMANGGTVASVGAGVQVLDFRAGFYIGTGIGFLTFALLLVFANYYYKQRTGKKMLW